MIFGKKKKQEELKEAPLGYWEEQSYMMAIPEDNGADLITGIFDRVAAIEGVEIKSKMSLSEERPGAINLLYEGEEYDVGFYPGDVTVPDMYLVNRTFIFPDEEMEKLKKADKALTIFMDFKDDVKKSYHLQLKLAAAMVPDLIGLIDESAEKLVPRRWVMMAASSKVVPAANDIFMVQAVSGEKGAVWLHTHGLCRCGLPELEVVGSDMENYNSHYHLISTFASYLIDKKGKIDIEQPTACIGMLINRQPVVATCVSWTRGLGEYTKLTLGGVSDRKEAHNTRTSIIFMYDSEEDMDSGKLTKVSNYNDLWGDNPLFFISDEETARMKALAMERFDCVKQVFGREDTHVLVKIGLPTDTDGSPEHIWFELLEFDGERFKGKLTQEPYDVAAMHPGDEAWFTVEDVTDWVIYLPGFSVNPGSAYVLA